jgi:hypothetical protein
VRGSGHVDPVCGMNVDEKSAASSMSHHGESYHRILSALSNGRPQLIIGRFISTLLPRGVRTAGHPGIPT